MAHPRTAGELAPLPSPQAGAGLSALAVEELKLKFTVASALLRELGERLVGQAHIALAELVKNSYDADATLVELSIEGNEIVVSDNGHGMTFEAFRDFWMRIGSPHKQRARHSPDGRPLTGSKGVGRLAAQFLAHRIELETSAGLEQMRAVVDWDSAVEAGDLTNAEATLHRNQPPRIFAGGSATGTRVVLRGLKQQWNAAALTLLARELWPLRPPFGSAAAAHQAFDIALTTSLRNAEQAFGDQMQAVLEVWDARIVGQLVPFDMDPHARLGGRRILRISVELGDHAETHDHIIDQCGLHSLSYEIRVFDLRGRKPKGISVSTAREYMNRFGGVHVYDTGFHLPYYGSDQDWLDIEIDHSHRRTRSRLLPEDLQHTGALEFVPTNSRLFGVARVDTGREHAEALKADLNDRDALTIQVTRDRLVENEPYRQLRDAVRFGIDFYAVHEARKHAREIERARPIEPLPVKAQRVEDVLERYRDVIPPTAYRTLAAQVQDVVASVKSEAEVAAQRAGLLGALATAGMTAIAFEHESSRRFAALERSLRGLRSAIAQGDLSGAATVSRELEDLLEQARETRRLFGSLLDEEDRTRRISPRARSVLDDVVSSLGPFAARTTFEYTDLDDIRLPAGTMAEWSALWQNLVVNAINATIDREQPLVRASASTTRLRRAILLEDNGTGVDPEHADHLFEPFRRVTTISRERRNLGFGGTGLGLTIVRMLGESLNCRVQFVAPRSPNCQTAVEVSWRQST